MLITRSAPVRVLAVVLGCYLVVRAVAEFFIIDVHNPATYRHDWGGPWLIGVLAVHVGPGALILARAVVVLFTPSLRSGLRRHTHRSLRRRRSPRRAAR